MDKNQQIIDSKLVLEYQSGNEEAMVLLVKRWHKLFCKKAFWLVKDPDMAKDIAQDSWKTIVNKVKHLKDPNSFGSWALRIVCNKSFDCIKANNVKRNKLDDYKNEQNIVAEDVEDEEKELLKTNLLKAIKSLSINQQMVIQMFYVEELSLKEISKTLNISVGTVKSRLFKARENLKLILKNKNYEN
ncbi:MAG TPA: sigma-70 family RNA polymerase sigma factor [Mariniflexile sp.]